MGEEEEGRGELQSDGKRSTVLYRIEIGGEIIRGMRR